VNWWDRLMGRPSLDDRKERKADTAALDELHASFRKVRARTDRLIAAYTQADEQRIARRRRA